MSKKSRDKGKRGEREAAKLLGGERMWTHAHDVYAFARYWEVKRVKDGYAPAYAALEEYIRHNEESGETGDPIVLARQDRKPWIIIMYADDWLREQENENDSVRPIKGQRSRREDHATLGRPQP